MGYVLFRWRGLDRPFRNFFASTRVALHSPQFLVHARTTDRRPPSRANNFVESRPPRRVLTRRQFVRLFSRRSNNVAAVSPEFSCSIVPEPLHGRPNTPLYSLAVSRTVVGTAEGQCRSNNSVRLNEIDRIFQTAFSTYARHTVAAFNDRIVSLTLPSPSR